MIVKLFLHRNSLHLLNAVLGFVVCFNTGFIMSVLLTLIRAHSYTNTAFPKTVAICLCHCLSFDFFLLCTKPQLHPEIDFFLFT